MPSGASSCRTWRSVRRRSAVAWSTLAASTMSNRWPGQGLPGGILLDVEHRGPHEWMITELFGRPGVNTGETSVNTYSVARRG